MFISSVSTILFNANPLLRYDGYYILSDILEIPNLRQKASTILSRKLGKWCLGLEEPEDPFLPKRHQWLFATYTVAAAIYRWIVVLSILYFLNKVFEPYRLKIIGQIIALGAFYGLLIQPLWKMFKFFKVPGRLGKVKRVRMYGTLAVFSAFVAALALVPLPMHVYAPLEVQARDAKSVYALVDGILDEVLVQPGDKVDKGQVLARLRNIDIDISIADLEGQRKVNEAQLAGLRRISFSDRRASRQIQQVKETLESINKQLAQFEDDRAKLSLVAPIAGTVLPAPLVEKQPDAEVKLAGWSGSPFDRENRGATLVAGSKLCQIGDPRRLEARLVIDQGDIDLVEEGQRVEIILAQSAERTYESTIERKASENLDASPPHLSSLHGGSLPTQMTADGVPRPLTPVFQALAPFPEDAESDLLRIGLVGQAKISTRPRTLLFRLYRYFSRTFNFEL
jgi:putative peptide zinc metalloprotease protein